MTELRVAEVVDGELVGYDPFDEFTEQWLKNRRYSPHTKEAYRRDVRQWLAWCQQRSLDPLAVRFTDVNAWGRILEGGDEGRPLAVSTVARKMSAVSSWYAFLVKLEAIPANPAAAADRPEVDRDFSPTVSFTHEDAKKMMSAAERGDPWIGPAAHALATWLVEMGTRATETCQIEVTDLTTDRGFRVVLMRFMKGGRRRMRTIPPPLTALLDDYLAWRVASEQVADVTELEGVLFVNGYGNSLTRKDIYRFVRRLAKEANIENAERITPHSFRHAWNWMARRQGAPLEDRQRAMGHKDPRTTQRYDQSGMALERDPSLLVAAAVSHSTEEEG